jgi:hypothetical protein
MNAKLVSRTIQFFRNLLNVFLVFLDFASDDINLRIRAMFVCPKKWQSQMKQIKSPIAKRSVTIEDHPTEEELDDFYLFW